MLSESSDEEKSPPPSSSSSTSSLKTSQPKKKEAKETENNLKSKSLITIPDTCITMGVADINLKPAAVNKWQSRLTTIRDTVDDDELILGEHQNLQFELEDKNPIQPIKVPDTLTPNGENPKTTTSRDVNETCLADTHHHMDYLLSNRFVNGSNEHVSTPLAVKRQLQEHGLLDLTNSPGNNNTQMEQPSPIKPKSSSSSNAILSRNNSGNIKKNPSEVRSTPVKVRRLE